MVECDDPAVHHAFAVTWPEREIGGGGRGEAAGGLSSCHRSNQPSGSGSLASVENPRKPKADRSMSFDEQRIR